MLGTRENCFRHWSRSGYWTGLQEAMNTYWPIGRKVHIGDIMAIANILHVPQTTVLSGKHMQGRTTTSTASSATADARNGSEYTMNTPEYQREYYRKNREKIIAYQKAYREKNKEHVRAREKEYYERNEDRIKSYMDMYREKNRDRINAQAKKWRDTHKEERREQSKKYYAKNREKLLERNKEYREKNREKIRAANKARYASMPLEERRERGRKSYAKYKDQIRRHQREKYAERKKDGIENFV